MSEPYATMADLARVYGVHLRTVRRWAAQDGWRRTRGRPVTYSLADAQASYERRRDHGRQKRAARPAGITLTTMEER